MRDVLTRVFLVHPDRQSWLAAGVWTVVAAVSVATAAWVAVQPGHFGDLHLVREWLSYFLAHSTDPYAHFDRQLDYPPIALVVLAPLHLIPEASLAAWFLPACVLITALAGWFFVGAVAERLYMRISTPQRVAIVAIMLSSGSVRGAIWRGQTVALSVLFGALALGWSRRRPFFAALALALCSFKPHLAVGFGLAILLFDGVNVVALAIAIVASGSLLVAASVHQSLVGIFTSYGQNLVAMYGPRDGVRGLLSMRWVIEDLVGDFGLATLVYAVTACASLLLIGVSARRAPDAAARAQAIAMALLWPLLFLPSHLYNGFVAAPVVWLLMWPESNLIRRESWRLIAVSAMVVFSVLDVPRVVRLASQQTEADLYWLFKSSYYLNPLRLVMIFTFILLVSLRRARQSLEPAP